MEKYGQNLINNIKENLKKIEKISGNEKLILDYYGKRTSTFENCVITQIFV